MKGIELAEKKLQGMLTAAEMAKKPSYSPGEVQEVLGFSDRTFWRMVSSYELDPETEQPRHPATLDSYMLRRSRRVRYDELAAYLARNNTYERNNAIDPRQMGLF